MMVEHIPPNLLDELNHFLLTSIASPEPFFLELFVHQLLSIPLLSSFPLSDHCGGGPWRAGQGRRGPSCTAAIGRCELAADGWEA
jgi:hypothetical protein